MTFCSASNSYLIGTTGVVPDSVRCPSMMCRASSASSARTDRRTSPSSATFSGNTLCGTSDATTQGMPLASSSPRTMLASTSDCVRKITTRSANLQSPFLPPRVAERFEAGRIDLEQDHRHVVVLWSVADERRDFAKHAFAQLVGRQVRVVFENPAEARFAEAVVRRVHRLADAVREQRAQIARAEVNRLLFEQPVEQLAAVQLQSKDESVRDEDLCLPPAIAVLGHVHQRRVSGARVRHRAFAA